jgi:MFS family permease
MTWFRRSGWHHAWIILAAACVLSIISRADSASFAVLVDPLADKFGWKRGEIGFAYSLAFLCSMPAMLVFGWLGDRLSARTLMLGASLMISGGTVMLGKIHELWHL